MTLSEFCVSNGVRTDADQRCFPVPEQREGRQWADLVVSGYLAWHPLQVVVGAFKKLLDPAEVASLQAQAEPLDTLHGSTVRKSLR